jgi:hypothetical protein
MYNTDRVRVYLDQTNKTELTPRQRRRVGKWTKRLLTK